MIITYRNIHKVTFPVFLLYSEEWDVRDGLILIEGKILDDKNMPGDCLGIRRLQTPQKNLYRLNKSVDSLIGILKQYTKFFIDYKGICFIYQKTLNCKLKYLKIRKVELKETASLLWVKGVHHPFTIPRPPTEGRTWVGIIHLHNLPWMLYEYSTEWKRNTRRKV